MDHFGSDASTSHTMSHPQQHLIGNTTQLIALKIRICKVSSNWNNQINEVEGKYKETADGNTQVKYVRL